MGLLTGVAVILPPDKNVTISRDMMKAAYLEVSSLLSSHLIGAFLKQTRVTGRLIATERPE
jgi:hypothetical protein